MSNSDDIKYTLTHAGNILAVRVEGGLLEELQEADGYSERMGLLYENAHEPYYTLQTADQFWTNLSEAPCFLTELDITDEGFADAVGDWYVYSDYMINDFTELLALGEAVEFTKV